MVAAAAVPLLGVVAAITVPGLMRARLAGNEISAIATLRSINAAQAAYAATCGGYASEFAELTRVAQVSFGGDASAVGSERSGYSFAMGPSTSATPVPPTAAGCTGVVSDYVAQASPVVPGSTGTRYFASNPRGAIFAATSAAFDDARRVE